MYREGTCLCSAGLAGSPGHQIPCLHSLIAVSRGCWQGFGLWPVASGVDSNWCYVCKFKSLLKIFNMFNSSVNLSFKSLSNLMKIIHKNVKM